MLPPACCSYTMLGNFCTKTARKIKKLGYARTVAVFYAGFFYSMMLLVCAVMGILSALVEQHNKATGSGKCTAGARAGRVSPVFSGIR
ncbi:MAG: hypothetical protein ABFC71_01645 [Methanoregula sp.]